MPLPAEAVKYSAGREHVSIRGKDDVNRIDPSLSFHPDITAVRPAGKNTGRPAVTGAAPVRANEVVAKMATGEIKPPVRPEVRPVLIRPPIELHASEDLLTFIRNPVVIQILQPPKVGRGDDVERPVMPQPPLRHGHAVRENRALVKNPVPVHIDQTPHKTGQLPLDGLPRGQVASVAFRHVQAPAIIEARHHRIPNQGRSRRKPHLESLRNLDLRRRKPVIGSKGGTRQSK